MRVNDSLREARRAGGVVELRRIVCRRIGADEIGRRGGQGVRFEHEDFRRPRRRTGRVLGVGDEQSRPRSPRADAGSRRHRTAPTSRAGSRRASRCRRRLRRSRHRRAAPRRLDPPRDAPRRQGVCRLVREILELAPVELADRTVEALQTIASLSRGCLSQTSAAMLYRAGTSQRWDAHILVAGSRANFTTSYASLSGDDVPASGQARDQPIDELHRPDVAEIVGARVERGLPGTGSGAPGRRRRSGRSGERGQRGRLELCDR